MEIENFINRFGNKIKKEDLILIKELSKEDETFCLESFEATSGKNVDNSKNKASFSWCNNESIGVLNVIF